VDEIPRTTTIVCERHYFQAIRQLNEDDVIRKTVNRHPANIMLFNSSNATADLRMFSIICKVLRTATVKRSATRTSDRGTKSSLPAIRLPRRRRH
jgi:hypothetical protein